MALPIDVEGTWVNPNSVQLDAGELRRADAAMFGGNGSAFGVLGGIVRHGDDSLKVTVDGSDIVSIKAGAVVIPGNAALGTGPYRFALGTDATAAGALTARHATNTRIDLLVARQLDTDVVNTHGAYKGRFQLVDGTPGGGAPALPDMAVELARITVPPLGGAAASVDLTHRTFACAAGAELTVTTSAMLPALALTRQTAKALDTGFRYRFDGTTWIQIDTDWTTLASNLTSGGIKYRRMGDEVWVHIDGSFSTTSGTPSGNLNSTPIPAALRPTPPVNNVYRFHGYFGGQDGHLLVNDSGNITALQNSGSTRTTVAGTFKYPLG